MTDRSSLFPPTPRRSIWDRILSLSAVVLIASTLFSIALPGKVAASRRSAYQFIALPVLDKFGMQGVCYFPSKASRGRAGILRDRVFESEKSVAREQKNNAALLEALSALRTQCKKMKSKFKSVPAFSFTLVDSETQQPIRGYDPLLYGTTLYLSELRLDRVSIVAVPRTGSFRKVLFGRGQETFQQTRTRGLPEMAGAESTEVWKSGAGKYNLCTSSDSGGSRTCINIAIKEKRDATNSTPTPRAPTPTQIPTALIPSPTPQIFPTSTPIALDPTSIPSPTPQSLVPSPLPTSTPRTIQIDPANLASLATVTASSSDTLNGSLASSAVDGIVDGYPNPGAASYEWATDPLGTAPRTVGAWIQLSWKTPVTIDRVIFHDRINNSDRIGGGKLLFDGNPSSEIAVPALPDDGSPLEVKFAPRAVSSLKFEITAVASSSFSIGLAEWKVFGTLLTPVPTATFSAQPSSTPVSPTRTATPTSTRTSPPATSTPVPVATSTPRPSPTVVTTLPPSATSTSIPVAPSSTPTKLPTATATATRTPVPPTVTPTSAALINLASYATVTASSADTASGALPAKAVDGIVDGYPNAGAIQYEWSSDRGKAGSWIQLTWPSPVTISRIVLHDRINYTDQILGGTLWFDGNAATTLAVGALPNDGTGLEVSGIGRTATTLRFELTSVAASTWSIGLAEIKVFGTSSALLPTPTPVQTPTPTVVPTSSGVALPRPPASYVLPAGAVQVSTTQELLTALQATTPRDIVLADGVYDHSSYFSSPCGHRLYAKNLGKAVLTSGIVFGSMWCPGGGTVQGLTFSITDTSGTKVFHDSVIHNWGDAKNTQILDVTILGNDAVGNGIMIRQPEGLILRRIVANHFTSNGILVDANNQQAVLTTPAILEDLDVSYVSRPVPLSADGTAESCIWIGNTAIGNRLRTINCSWMGVWTGTAAKGLVLSDITVDKVMNAGVYFEHFTSNSTLRRLWVGSQVKVGAICEWADPGWGSLPGCDSVVIEDSTFNSSCVGLYLDDGTKTTTVRRTTFKGQSWAAIGDYRGVGNLWDISGNNTTGINPGAVAISRDHYGGKCP